MSLSSILAMADEDEQFEAFTELHEQLIEGASLEHPEDLERLAGFLSAPTFPENEAIAWTVAIALPSSLSLCQLASSKLNDDTAPNRELIAQYLRFHCADQFQSHLEQLLSDGDVDVRFEAIEYLAEQSPAAGLPRMLAVADQLSHTNYELLRQYLVKFGTDAEVAFLQENAGGRDDPNVYNDLLQTIAQVRPELLRKPHSS